MGIQDPNLSANRIQKNLLEPIVGDYSQAQALKRCAQENIVV